jgi:hypothetical protein
MGRHLRSRITRKRSKVFEHARDVNAETGQLPREFYRQFLKASDILAVNTGMRDRHLFSSRCIPHIDVRRMNTHGNLIARGWTETAAENGIEVKESLSPQSVDAVKYPSILGRFLVKGVVGQCIEYSTLAKADGRQQRN